MKQKLVEIVNMTDNASHNYVNYLVFLLFLAKKSRSSD